MTKIKAFALSPRAAATGQAVSEYGVTLSLIGVATVTALIFMGGNIQTLLGMSGNHIQHAGAGILSIGDSAANDAAAAKAAAEKETITPSQKIVQYPFDSTTQTFMRSGSLDTGSSAKTVTAANGQDVIQASEALMALAQKLLASDSPEDRALGQIYYDLAQQGLSLGKAEGNGAVSDMTAEQKTQASNAYWAVYDSAVNLAKDGFSATSNKYGATYEDANKYLGIISNIGYHNYEEKINPPPANTNASDPSPTQGLDITLPENSSVAYDVAMTNGSSQALIDLSP